jgi:hypothetical protein
MHYHLRSLDDLYPLLIKQLLDFILVQIINIYKNLLHPLQNVS